MGYGASNNQLQPADILEQNRPIDPRNHLSADLERLFGVEPQAQLAQVLSMTIAHPQTAVTFPVLETQWNLAFIPWGASAFACNDNP